MSDRNDAARALGMVPAVDAKGVPYVCWGAQVWVFPDEQTFGPSDMNRLLESGGDTEGAE